MGDMKQCFGPPKRGRAAPHQRLSLVGRLSSTTAHHKVGFGMGNSLENVGKHRSETDTVILRGQDLKLCRRRLTQTDADLRPSPFAGCRCPHSTVVAGALRRWCP